MVKEIELTNLNIGSAEELISPSEIKALLPASEKSIQNILESRKVIENILDGSDPRLFVVMGPCSIHDPVAALEYARKLKTLADEVKDQLFLVMRVYFEKPRTTVGWKGLINDPHMDDSFHIEEGLKLARKLLLDFTDLGLPTATEALDPITPQYMSELISWSAIGARTTESQTHREMASGLSMPVGFKNGTDGNIQIASDAIKAVQGKHHFLSVTKQGISAIVATRGNDSAHAILRGARGGPNYSSEHVKDAVALLTKNGLEGRLMIDCSHGNSGKAHENQLRVCDDVAAQLSSGSRAIMGVMIESHLVAGRQDEPKIYGQSITDACIDWPSTTAALQTLASAVAKRRSAV